MIDREKVIERLENLAKHAVHYVCEPPFVMSLDDGIALRDAIAMLKAQEPRVMTPADVNNIGPEDVCAFIEIREEAHMYACYMHQYDETHTEIMCDVPDMPTKLQNGCARLWSSRPTDKQRAETPWEGR